MFDKAFLSKSIYYTYSLFMKFKLYLMWYFIYHTPVITSNFRCKVILSEGTCFDLFIPTSKQCDTLRAPVLT